MKITKATLKSFIKVHRANLYVKVNSSFDGMTDCVMAERNTFTAAQVPFYSHVENDLGVAGVYLVGGSRNYFQAYNADGFTGIRTINCCGSFTVAVKTAA